ncbi:MAG: sigma-70 family RNA polymerase sigma factor [Bacteroidales bacterium]|jgi:RNA polymerase sigma-70 factor (ECF subfamily)|nr:sigma-70 family RNA polymerase sigma factor [Bacteroidales bacterium]MCK9498263.1 sigma-70 family RNA polymerase sigma factor [Bacteroidales bacterium]MDY0313443.1 sigma-70 family RNA polymerase sigma factor [Bacteroidales bacterium]NLB86143.1 sigma-70 family RNA polymerase sigma factor [Bacteroidales bacterium]
MKLKNFSDQELIERFIEGDKESMETLIHRHKKNIYSYILMNVKNTHIADDLFQETFIKVINSLKQGNYVDRGKFVSWVIRIAHNLSIDYFRREKNLNTYSNDDSSIDLFNSEKFSPENIEDQIIGEQIANDIKSLIEFLPEEQKEIVMLRHYGGMSFKEIAEQTNVSINTALGRMRYALINLRKIIEEKNIILTK